MQAGADLGRFARVLEDTRGAAGDASAGGSDRVGREAAALLMQDEEDGFKLLAERGSDGKLPRGEQVGGGNGMGSVGGPGRLMVGHGHGGIQSREGHLLLRGVAGTGAKLSGSVRPGTGAGVGLVGGGVEGGDDRGFGRHETDVPGGVESVSPYDPRGR